MIIRAVRPVLGKTLAIAAMLGAAVLCVSACGEKRSVKPAEAPPVVRDVPDAFRGTIGSEATFRGIEPVLVSGLGIVVGLNGTGGGELPVQVQATMERDLARGGVGKGGASANTDLGPISPAEFLRSPNVAVVIVQAAIPPGAPKGVAFDVFVRTLPGSSVTSLEGGRLWTTDLRFGEPAVFGAIKTRKIAEAKGDVFLNPFSGASSGGGQVTKTVGRIIGGGQVTDPLAIEVVLDNDSHARARSVVAAINSRFPPGSGDEGPIARGRGRSGPQEGAAQSIALSVPAAYKERAAEFIQLVRHLRVDQGFQQEYAKLYVDEMKAKPALASELSWCVQALGKAAIPFLTPMYDYAEVGPRFAALEAGARLGDHRAVGPLAELSKTGPSGIRAQAIRLLSRMPSNPTVNLTLRELTASPDLDVRVAAYEGLRDRGDVSVTSVPVGPDRRHPKFTLDIVPGGEPLVYVTQQGEARVVLFGSDEAWRDKARRSARASGIMLNRPATFGVWEDRLLMASEGESGPIRLRYVDPRPGMKPLQMPKVPDDLGELVPLLAQKTTPEDPAPGLNLTYSEVVGVLYEMTRQGAVTATFATEEDRLRAEIFEASQSKELADRPETSEGAGPAETVQVFKSLDAPAVRSEEKTGSEKLTRVVPIQRAVKKKE